MADPAESSEKAPEKVELTGSTQAAILLMALGEEEAATVLKHMKPEEVQAVGEAMAAINGVTQEQIGETLDEFINRVRNESSLGLESAKYFKSTLTRALGKDKATSVLASMEPMDDDSGLSSLQWMDPRVVAKIISKEHPQIIAMSDLNEIIQELFENNGTIELSGLGGVSSVADILNSVSKEAEEQILATIEESDSDIVAQIKESMFIFENLLAVTDRDTQTLLRDLSNDDLILALKGASEEMQEKIFRNMSSRAAELLKDDLEAKGPVKLSEVEEAQRTILTAAKEAAEEGKISLGGKGDDYV